jgi:hypothetical protein
MTMASASTPTPMIVSPIAGRARAVRCSGEPEFLEDAFDPRRLRFQKGLVLVAEQRDRGPVAHLAGLGPLRRRRHLLHQCDHRLALRVIHTGGSEHAAPVEQLHINAFLLQGRRVDPLLALVRRHGNDPQLAGLHLLGEFTEARDAGCDLVAEQRRGRRPAAGEGDIADLGRGDTERLGDHAEEDVIGAAG